MNQTPEPEFVEHASSLPFNQTVERLIAAITRSGATLFIAIDHAENARKVGMSMPPTTVLVYGNPKGGTPIMLATPVAAFDLPLRVLIRETEGGKVLVGFHPIVATLKRDGVPESGASRLEPAQNLLLAAIAP